MPEITLQSIWAKGWFESVNGTTSYTSMIIHFLIAAIVLFIIVCMSTLMGNTMTTPSPPPGYINYEVAQATRSGIAPASPTPDLSTVTIGSVVYPGLTPMSLFQVATANFGGIYTEQSSWLNPWLGSVAADAVTSQVEAGARAVIFDVWPDPANPGNPIVASMYDVTQWYYQNQWASPGNMNQGVGRYSNWNLLTRNTGALSDILTAATNAAFNGPSSNQNGDPFFIILNLHGAMTAAYLNLVGTIITSAVDGHAMGPEWTLGAANNATIQTAPISQFMGRAFVIAIPDIQTGYFSLKGINTLSGFNTAVLPALITTTNPYSSFINAVNLIPTTTSQLMYTPDALSTVQTLMQPTAAGAPIAIIQPSIGAQVTDNDSLFGLSAVGYSDCMNSKAQFVGINFFTPSTSENAMTLYTDPTNGFGKYSFKYIGPPI